MGRVELTDNMVDVFTKMADGNPGALTAMIDLFKNAQGIDPQGAIGGVGPILSLDQHEIYGSSIYVLYSDKCGRDARQMCVLLRSVQLGFLDASKLQAMAADQMREVNLSNDEWLKIDALVCNRLDDFQRPAQEQPND